MDRIAVNRLKSVNDFDSLLTYLREELDWPVDDYGFDDLTFQYTAAELGLDEQSAAKVTEIRRLVLWTMSNLGNFLSRIGAKTITSGRTPPSSVQDDA